MNKKIICVIVVLMLVILLFSGCGEKEEPIIDEPTNGDDDNGLDDLFPDNPDLSRMDVIENKIITLSPGQAKTIEFSTTIEDKYAVVYWELNPFTEEAGETIAFRFKTGEGWELEKHKGRTNQVMVNVTINNYGEWALWIKHETAITGYELPITVDYRIFVLG